MPASATRYDPVAIFLHWSIALMILLMLPMGFLMEDAPSSLKPLIYNLHKSIGLTIIALSLFRIVWRLLNPPPALPDSMPRSQKILAHAAHWALYAFIIGMPLSGWLMVSATAKYPIDFFGLGIAPFLPMPHLEDAKATGHMLTEWHESIAYGGIALLVVHIGAALKHHFVAHDGILQRMLPLRPKK